MIKTDEGWREIEKFKVKIHATDLIKLTFLIHFTLFWKFEKSMLRQNYASSLLLD